MTRTARTSERGPARQHSRVRRAVKIVGPWRVGVSLVFGVVATMFVALWIALEPAWMPEFPYGERIHGKERYFVGDKRTSDGRVFEVTIWIDYGHWAKAYTAPSTTETLESWIAHYPYAKEADARPSWIGGLGLATELHPIRGEAWFEEESFGWPFRSLRLQHLAAGGRYYEYGCMRVNSGIVNNLKLGTNRIPTGIAALGFVFDAVFFGTLPYLVLSLPTSRRRYWRKKRIQCDTCGYELVGLKGDLCPECGSTIDERRKKRASGVTDS